MSVRSRISILNASFAALLQLLFQASQVSVHIIIAMIFSQVNQHSCSTATVSGPTEAAVTDPSAWRTLPLRIQQSVSDLLSVAVTETGATELTPHPHTLWVTAVGFGVGRFLAALVASGSSGAVVHFLPHVVADSLQLCLCDVLHRPHHMRDGLGTVEGTTTGWLVDFLIATASANQAELVLRLFLWRWAGGSVHKCAGPCVGSGQTLRVSPTSSWSSHGPPRRLSGRSGCGHCHPAWEESRYFVQLCHELCKHFFVLLNIQCPLVHEVLLLLRVRVLCFNLSERFRRRPLLACLLGGERHGHLQDAGPTTTSQRFRVNFHCFHLTVDLILLKPAACVLLRCSLRHLGLSCRPPRLS